MGIFNFKDHAAKATENLREQRDPSIRMFEGVRLKAKITDLIQKTGDNPKIKKSKGKYVSTGFKFSIEDVERLADSTDAQMEFAKGHIGKGSALVYNLFGDPGDDVFAERNEYSIKDLLSLTFAGMVNNIARNDSVESAREFKSPFFAGNYPTEEERQNAVGAVGATLDGAFEGEEDEVALLVGSTVYIDVAPGKLKNEANPDEGRWYNLYFKPCFDVA